MLVKKMFYWCFNYWFKTGQSFFLWKHGIIMRVMIFLNLPVTNFAAYHLNSYLIKPIHNFHVSFLTTSYIRVLISTYFTELCQLSFLLTFQLSFLISQESWPIHNKNSFSVRKNTFVFKRGSGFISMFLIKWTWDLIEIWHK